MSYRIGLFLLILTACTDVAKTKVDHKILQHENEVSSWITLVKMNAVQEAQTISAQQSGALLTVALPSKIPQFFVATQAEAPKALSNVQKNTLASGFMGQEGGVFDSNQAQINRDTPMVTVKKRIDLSQASLSDLQYVGLLTQNTKTWGMVKVGERLYPVNVGDVIGQGRWPIISLNEQNMQLKIANKAVTYDKN